VVKLNELSAAGESGDTLLPDVSNLLVGISKRFSRFFGWNSGLGGGALG